MINKIKIFLIGLLLSGLLINTAHAAIAFDSYKGNDFGNSSSGDLTIMTSTFSNGLLVCGFGQNGSNADESPALTYHGVSMTRTSTINTGAGAAMRMYLFYIFPTTTGAFTVHWSMGTPHFNKLACASWTGINQTTGIDSIGKATGDSVTSLTVTTSVPTAGSWVGTFFGDNNNTPMTMEATVTLRGQVNDSYYIVDTNAATTSPVASMTATAAAEALEAFIFTLPPVASVAGAAPIGTIIQFE